MNKEQFEELIEAVRMNLIFFKSRLGQAIFNEFKTQFPNEVEQIRATENDCFHENSRIIDFMEKIFELTNATKDCKEYWYNSNVYNVLTQYQKNENPN